MNRLTVRQLRQKLFELPDQDASVLIYTKDWYYHVDDVTTDAAGAEPPVIRVGDEFDSRSL